MVMQARSRGSFLRLHTDPTPCLNKPSQGCSTQGALAALLRCMFWCSTGQRRLRHLQHHSVLVSAVNSKKGYLVHSHAGCPQKYIVYVSTWRSAVLLALPSACNKLRKTAYNRDLSFLVYSFRPTNNKAFRLHRRRLGVGKGM